MFHLGYQSRLECREAWLLSLLEPKDGQYALCKYTPETET